MTAPSLQQAFRTWLVAKVGSLCGDRVRETPDARDPYPYVLYQVMARTPTPRVEGGTEGQPLAEITVNVYAASPTQAEQIRKALADAVEAEPAVADWSGLLVQDLRAVNLGSNDDGQAQEGRERPAYFGQIVDLSLNYSEV